LLVLLHDRQVVVEFTQVAQSPVHIQALLKATLPGGQLLMQAPLTLKYPLEQAKQLVSADPLQLMHALLQDLHTPPAL